MQKLDAVWFLKNIAVLCAYVLTKHFLKVGMDTEKIVTKITQVIDKTP